MSSVVSHQILQQLGVIGIHAGLLRHAAGAGEQVRTNAVAIERALGEVNRVLHDLLVFSKDLKLNVYEHPLVRVVDEAVGAAPTPRSAAWRCASSARRRPVHRGTRRRDRRRGRYGGARRHLRAAVPGGRGAVLGVRS